MAGKRTATNELTHDNWDDDDEPEEAGRFKRAPDEVIRNRVIKTARRRHPVSEEKNEKQINVFSGFDGFKKPNNDNQKNISSAFSTNAENTITTNTFALFKNITAPKVPSSSTSINSLTSPFKIPEVPSTNTFMKQTDLLEKDISYYTKLKGLNECVLDWIKLHVEKNPFIILTPIFTDYDKHLTQIEKDDISSKQEEKSLGNQIFSNSIKSSTHSASIFGNISSKSSDSILSNTTGDKPKDAVSAVSVSESSITSFSFGSKVSNSSSAGFSFGTGTPFLFANVSSVTIPDTSNSISGKTETSLTKSIILEDEDEPPKVEFTPVVEDGSVFQKRCKVFIKKTDQYSDRGVGQLFLKPVEGSKKIQLIVRADTSLGNLLLNFILNTSIPIQRMGKNNVMMVSIPTPDCKPPPVPILLRVKTPEEADELLKVLLKHRK